MNWAKVLDALDTEIRSLSAEARDVQDNNRAALCYAQADTLGRMKNALIRGLSEEERNELRSPHLY